MPRFDRELSAHVKVAIGIVKAGEITRLTGDTAIRKEWSISRLEALYELAYLRTFAAWETLLESVFYRSLCGYVSSAGQETLIGRPFFPHVKAAEAAVLGSGSYLLWHDPQKVINRCKSFIKSGPGYPALQEITISSNINRLRDLASTRHRIVHDQADAKRKFDVATNAIAARTYPASRPGKFLRDWDKSSVPPKRWLEVTTAELTALASQMV